MNLAFLLFFVQRETRHAIDYYECNSVSEDGGKKKKRPPLSRIVMRVVISSQQELESALDSSSFCAFETRKNV